MTPKGAKRFSGTITLQLLGSITMVTIHNHPDLAKNRNDQYLSLGPLWRAMRFHVIQQFASFYTMIRGIIAAIRKVVC